MQRILASFRSLGWKLTFNYTLTTVAVLLAAEAALILIGLAVLLRSDMLPSLMTSSAYTAAQSLAPYLEKQPPDVQGIESWLVDAALSGYTVTGEDGRESRFHPGTLSQGESLMMVVNQDLQPVAAVPEVETGETYPVHLAPGYEGLISRIQAGEREPVNLFQVSENDQLTFAVPVQSQAGGVVGYLVFGSQMIPTSAPFEQVLPLLGSSALVFTTAALVVGTIFGFFTARGLVRRLRRVYQAADAWSRGDFSVFVQDASGDELSQLTTRLNQMAEQLQTLLHTQQELATVEERNRLARELHDSVKQQVFAAGMQVGAARELVATNPQAIDVHLAEAERLTRLAQQELTVLIRQLRPAALGDKGLVKALREYLGQWAEHSGLQAELKAQGERNLPLEVEQALFRIAQEALANIARHSQAKAVEIHLAFEAQQVVLTIGDNGRGFDPRLVSGKGVGLNSMRERAEAFAGSLEIKSGASGTQVIARFPTTGPVLSQEEPSRSAA